uniref:Glucose-methanol-choline oxidoreductase n=1 Tax=Borely moumouvirus TaxID=2712067 RepID=A0A6G6AD75_9VIRU
MQDYCACKECCYDYIVVGAGCGGSVIAARLAEDKNNRVLLLEGGPDNSLLLQNNNINDYQKKLISTPAFLYALFPRYHVNPTLRGCSKYESVGHIEPSPSHLEFTTVKEYGRYYTYPRGNGAGGSTNHHNLIDGRGSHLPYERIAKEMNDSKWTYDNILKYYKKMENFYDEPEDEFHGNDGWLEVKYSGLENEFSHELIRTIQEELGAPFVKDLNIPGQYSGLGINTAQVDKRGMRSYAFKDLLVPMLLKQQNLSNKNLFVKFNSLVSKVLLDDTRGNVQAFGVEVLENPNLYSVDTTGNKVANSTCTAILPNRDNFTVKKYYAKKEVILCGGVFNTPQILMLSGLGPEEHLKDLGIPVVVNLPGVGQNLMDHHEFCMNFEIDPKKFMWRWQAAYLHQDIHRVPDEIKPIVKKYRDVTGFTENGCQLVLDWHSGLEKINMDEPDLHFQILNTLFFDFNLNFIKVEGDNLNEKQTKKDNDIPNPLIPTDPHGLPLKDKFFGSQYDPEHPRVFMGVLIENMKINSWDGSVTLKSTDPRDAPIIELGLWKDDVTLERLARAVFLMRQVMKSPNMMQFSHDPNNYARFEILPGPKADSIEKIMEYLRTWSSIGHHAAGTAKMGRDDDKMAVVDSSLRVRGVKGLRIVDASVYPAPHLHAYNPTRGIYMIAEMISDVIKNGG